MLLVLPEVDFQVRQFWRAMRVWGLLQFETLHPSCGCSEKSNERLQDEVQRGEAAAEALRRRLSEAEEVSVRAL